MKSPPFIYRPPVQRLSTPWLLLLLCAWLLCAAASARPLAQYPHRAFVAADGAPDEIVGIGQTSDSMLWLGAATGIYTFDGQHFSRHPVEYRQTPRPPYFLRVDPRDGVWIGWKGGGVTVIRQQAVQHYDVADGIPGGTVWGFDFDQDGGVWAAGMHGVARFDGRRWHLMGPKDGFGATNAAAVSVDPAGNVGVFTDKGLYVLRKGARRFDAPIGKTETRQPLAIGPQGQMYFMDQSGIRRITSLQRYDRPDHVQLYREKDDTTGSFLADRDGGMWFDSHAGLHHVEHAATDVALTGTMRSGSETVATGIAGTVVYQMFEDNQGDIWVSTDAGLNRFRPSALTDIGKLLGEPLIQASLLPGAGGSIWVRTFFPRTAWLRLDAAGKVAARYEGALDGAAVSTGTALVTVNENGRLVTLADGVQRIAGPPLPKSRVNGMARDAAGMLWVALSNGTVLRGDGAGWTPVAGLPAGRVTTIKPDAGGAVWIGYLDNQLVHVKAGLVTRYGAAQGLATGTVSGIVRIGATLWVTGARGLNRMDGGRFAPIAAVPGLFDDLADAMADARGGLWLSGRAGLMYVTAAQLAQCRPACPAPLAPALFDTADGLNGRTSPLGQGQLAQDAAQRIWVATGNGVYRIEGNASVAAGAPPQVLVTGATAAGQRHAGVAALQLPAGTHDVQVDYTAPVPDTPERVRFRYRLAGYDHAWQEVGTRRQAFYTGLAPGRYRFEVTAAHGNSGWSAQPALLAIEILPAWYQMWWWRTVSTLALLGGLALLYRARVRRLTDRVRAQEEARQHERERIARELHDTVLQTNFALLLQVRSVAATAAGNPLAERLDTIVRQAQATLAEGRDKIAGLRAQQDQLHGFAATLAHTAAGIVQGSGIALICTSHGQPWPFSGRVATECCAIVVEAVTNARKHAQASTLRIDVHYTWRRCIIAIADDGTGIAPQFLAGRTGHWGLAGMRERAALLKARFDVGTGPSGTTVRLQVRRFRF